MSFHLKRPKRDDKEDDLLKFQEEFLRNKGSEQPAAKVIKNPKMSENLQDTENIEDKSQKMEIDSMTFENITFATFDIFYFNNL